MSIIFLFPFLNRRRQRPAQRSAQSAGRKRTASESVGEREDSEASTSISYRPQLQQLMQKLACQRHGGYCYVNPITAEHVELDYATVSLWAKKIVRYSLFPSF
jgi:hypothetical protein